MNLKERATIIHYHRHRIATFGDGTVGALGWREADSQRVRFEVIADAVDFEGRSVLDVGCGHGDLCGFLLSRFDNVSYVGLEQVPEFVQVARDRYGTLPNTWFHCGDAVTAGLPGVDCVVASGTLNYRCEDPRFHYELIRRLYDAADEVLVFNVLVAARFPEHPLLRGHDPEEVASFCRGLSDAVDIIEGYAKDDVTFCVRRPDGDRRGRGAAAPGPPR
jgi:SAM-dependent methyltransferase